MRWWQECDEYRVQVAAYRGKDARDALVVYAATLLAMLALGIYHRVAPEWPGNAAAVAIGLIELVVVGGLIAILLRRRGLSAAHAGFSRTHLGRSLIAGLVLTAIGLGVTRLIGMADGYVPPFEPYWLTYALPYYLIAIGFTEELIFRGYMAPRIESVFTKRWKGTAVVGALFAVSHLPFRAVTWTGSLGEFLLDAAIILPITFGWHLVLAWLFRKWNSLAAPTLVHFAINSGSFLM